MMRKFVLVSLCSVFACADANPDLQPIVLSEIEFSTPPESGEPNLFTLGDETLLSWFEPSDDGQALRFSRNDGTGWAPALTITSGREYFVNWADFPSMTRMEDGQLLVHWPEKTAASTYAYHVMVSTSPDNGITWTEPASAHMDQSATEHGFVSVVPSESGADLIWLDGQNTGGGEGHGGSMQVRSGSWSMSGERGPELLIDARACDCCQTALVRTPSGLVAAYRDRSEEEIRDIAVTRLTDAGWSDPLHVGNDNWHFPACPVNGPSLSAIDDHIAIAWYASPEGDARVQVAFTNDGGASFGSPFRIAGTAGVTPEPLGRVDVELLNRNVAMVSWLEREGDLGRIWARTVSAEGAMGDPILISETNPNRRSGFPRMARVGDDLVFAWTVIGEDGGIRVARMVGVGG